MTCFERHNVLTTYTDFFGKWHKEIKENLTGQNNQEFEVLPVRLNNFEIIIDLFARKVFFGVCQILRTYNYWPSGRSIRRDRAHRGPCVLTEGQIFTRPARPHSFGKHMTSFVVHLWGVLTLPLYFRSRLATEVVLHWTVHQDSKIHCQNAHFHSIWRKQNLAEKKSVIALILTCKDFAGPSAFLVAS